MTLEEQDRLIEDLRSSGKTIRQWSEEHHMSYHTLNQYSWQYNHRHGLTKRDNMKPAVIELIPVRKDTPSLKVQIGNCSIDVNDDTDMNLLKKISQALQ